MNDSEARFARLERQLRTLRLAAGISTALLLVFTATALRRPDSSADVLRVRGLIVVDDMGRDRILIGAPIPASGARVRTDTARVRQMWGTHFAPQYMSEWYPTYRNAVHGIVVLDERGIDRVAIGDSLPDPNIGRRIGSDVGILVNDANGYERTGYGLLTVKGRNRAVLGLDADNGTEGLTLAVRDSGATGITITSHDHNMFIGADPTSEKTTGKAPFFGIVARDGKTVKHETNILARLVRAILTR